jgi:hypothetical protein
MDSVYTLRVPLTKDHWILLASNKEMTAKTFAALDRYLALQKEVVAEDASAIEAAAAGETPQSGSTEGESAVGAAETPKHPHDQNTREASDE